MKRTIKLSCPGKVNLALSLARPIQPKGFHPIATWMVTLDLCDDLELTALEDEGQSSWDIRFADVREGAVRALPQEVDWPLEKDLAYRAWQGVQALVGRELRVGVRLIKRIPTGGGLGGGSSDAAGMLVGLDRLFELGLSEQQLIEQAAKLGSDVPFFVRAREGESSMLVGGLGEELTGLPLKQKLDVVLVFPGVACPTGEIYQAFDRLCPDAPAEPDVERVIALAQAVGQAVGMSSEQEFFNDLEQAAVACRPELGALMAGLKQLGHRPHITGSGSTIFAVVADTGEAVAAAERIRDRLGLPAIPSVAG